MSDEKARKVPTMARKLSNGRMGHFKRVDLQTMMVFGVMPEALTRIALQAAKGEVSEEEIVQSQEQATVEDHLKNIIFYRRLFEQALVSPTLKNGATTPDEIDPSELSFEEDILWNVYWQMAGCPGLLVRTEGGETSIEGLGSFRGKKSGKKSPRARKHKSRVRRKTK